MHGRLILGLFLLALTFKAQSAQSLTYQESHALVIGVSQYTHGWPSLTNVVAETRDVQAALERIGFQVRSVSDPDKAGLSKAFEKFIQDHGAQSQNRLLFYFSGHGFTSNKRGYLVGADAPELEGDGEGLREKSLSMKLIQEWCREMKAKHAIFLFDSCFHDSLFPEVAMPTSEGRVGSLTGRPVRQFITAGTAGEQLPKKSVFARMFVRALRGDADTTRDGDITGSELARFLRDRLTYYDAGQVPQYGKIRDPDLDEGDFVFVMSPNSGPMESAQKLYIPIFEIITEGDSLKTAGQGRSALEKYLAAERDLKSLQKAHPNWNANIVNFRLKYLSDQIGPLQVRFPRTVPSR
ncbi:MAG: caspase family protein [Limisphaerales bacterium]